MKYIVTFGSGQKHENHYVRIISSEYSNVVEYMDKIHNNEYCMIYNLDDWKLWEEVVKKNNLMIESELYRINLDKDEKFVLLDTDRNMYWRINNYGYTRELKQAKKFTFAEAMEKVYAPCVDDLDMILYSEAEKLLPEYENKLFDLIENVNVSKTVIGENEIELEFKDEQSEEEVKVIKKFIIDLLQNNN